MSKCSLDIIITCSLGLETGLRNHFPHFKKQLPNYTLDLVEWYNKSMISFAKQPEHVQALSLPGRILSKTSEKTFRGVANALNPDYRKFYYATRFTEAYKLLNESIIKDGVTNIVDYGRGLSPLIHLLKTKYPHIRIFSKEIHPVANAIDAMICEKYNMVPNTIIQDLRELNPKETALASLGTFTYINAEEQVKELEYIAKNFPRFLIELDMENADLNEGDNKFIRKLFGTGKYNPLSVSEIQRIFGKDMPIVMPDFDTGDLPNNIAKAIYTANECFVRK
ncbi:MAG: hypothetical protein FWC83_01560 [Alphaproteobacteria bacterium]|nr:hypothetical protein [Alphaproteobacteria bacterium]